MEISNLFFYLPTDVDYFIGTLQLWARRLGCCAEKYSQSSQIANNLIRRGGFLDTGGAGGKFR